MPTSPSTAPSTPKQLAPSTGVATSNIDFVLFSLDDRELDLAIADQESMLKRVPSAAPYMEPALAAHRAERERRSACTNERYNVDTATGDCEEQQEEEVNELTSALVPTASPEQSPPMPESREPASPPPTKLIKRKKSRSRTTPYSEARPLRIRFGPERYGGENKPVVGSRKHKYESPALQAQYEINQILREQLRTNQTQIEDTAAYFRCALTAQKPRKVLVTPNGTRHEKPVDCPYLGAMIKKLAVADDGYWYDFSHITQCIRDNSHHLLRSPVTGEPMSGQVYYMGKCKTTKKPKILVWTPDIFVREELEESETETDIDASAAPSAALAVD